MRNQMREYQELIGLQLQAREQMSVLRDLTQLKNEWRVAIYGHLGNSKMYRLTTYVGDRVGRSLTLYM